MSNPQGPGRHPNDEDATEQTGELPAWGAPPPGGWGAARGADGTEHTGAWSPESDRRDGWGGAADAGWDPAAAPRDASRDAGATGAWSPQGTGGWAADDTAGWAADDTAGWRAEDTARWRADDTAGWQAEDTRGWNAADDTGGWAAQGTTGRHGTDAAPAAAPWGDDQAAGGAAGDGATWAVPTGRRGGRRRAPEEPTDAVPAGSPASAWGDEQQTVAQPSDGGGWASVEPGEEPWAPREAVRSPLGATKKWALVGGGLLLVALVVLSALVWPAWALPARLDQTALQAGVNQVLTQDYGLSVGAVQCPDDVTVSTGTRFSCQAVVDGEQVEVPGVITSDAGDYQVDRV